MGNPCNSGLIDSDHFLYGQDPKRSEVCKSVIFSLFVMGWICYNVKRCDSCFELMDAKMLKKIGNKKALYVMAAEPEYGQFLAKLFTPLITGIGPVEAAISLTAQLGTLKHKENLPDVIINVGSAGSSILPHLGIYQVSSVGYRDMDASPLGYVKGETPLLDLPAILPLPWKIEGIKSASLSTGASVISGQGYDEIEADMVDMETFALARVCHQFDIPLIALRGISDGKKELSQLTDWTEYLHIIDEKLADSVGIVEDAIANGRIL